MSKIYFDTGALVKLYIVETGSRFVQRKARAASLIPLNQLQETELRNAIHAAIGRNTIPATAGMLALENLETDIRNGVLAFTPMDWNAAWTRAAHLARLHTRRLLCRTLDILHVAAAESCGVDLVVTGDERQLRLCKAVGLPVTRVPSTET
jgi:predicted nucleic acid-binding protein